MTASSLVLWLLWGASQVGAAEASPPVEDRGEAPGGEAADEVSGDAPDGPADDPVETVPHEEAATRPPTPAKTTAPASSAGPAPLVTLVLGFSETQNLAESELRALNESLVFELSQLEGRRVLGPEDIRGMIELEAQKELLGCTAASCLSEIGAALDADRMVQGTVEQVGGGWFVVLTELDARNLRPVARVQRRVTEAGFHRLLPQMRSVVAELAARGTSDEEHGTLIVTSNPPAEVLLEGRSFGFTPAVVPELSPGLVRLELLVGREAVRVPVRVYPGQPTTVSATLDTWRGATPDEQETWKALDIWTRVGGAAVVGLGCATCCASPCLAFTGVAGDLVGLGQVTTQNGTFHAGYLIALGCFSTLSLGICGTGAGVAAWGAGREPVSEKVHRFVLTPPPALGEPETVDIDPETGKELPPLAEAEVPGGPSSVAAMAH